LKISTLWQDGNDNCKTIKNNHRPRAAFFENVAVGAKSAGKNISAGGMFLMLPIGFE
jgi:hypothetical protein